MITIEIPGRKPLHIAHVVLDYNGTIAVDGILLEGVGERIARLQNLSVTSDKVLSTTLNINYTSAIIALNIKMRELSP